MTLPALKGAGHSEYTAEKQDHYSKFLGYHIQASIGSATNARYHHIPNIYQHFDLNGGAGSYDNGTFGSPIIFINKLFDVIGRRKSDASCKIISSTYEINKDMYNSLIHTICTQPFIDSQERYEKMMEEADSGKLSLKGILKNVSIHLEYLNASHIDVLSNMPINNQTTGLVYSDENGAGVPIELLSLFAEKYPRMDILIHCTGTAIKRTRKSFQNKMSFIDIIKKCPKRVWHVREPFTAWQWTFLYGCNWPKAPVLKGQHFHSILSQEGKELIEYLDKTAAERSSKEQSHE